VCVGCLCDGLCVCVCVCVCVFNPIHIHRNTPLRVAAEYKCTEVIKSYFSLFSFSFFRIQVHATACGGRVQSQRNGRLFEAVYGLQVAHVFRTRDLLYGKRDLSIWQKRPIIWQKRPVYMAKKTLSSQGIGRLFEAVYGLQVRTYTAKETCLYGKRDLSI